MEEEEIEQWFDEDEVFTMRTPSITTTGRKPSEERHSHIIFEEKDALTPRQRKIIGKHGLDPSDLEKGFGLHTMRSLELAIRAAAQPRHICKCTDCMQKPDKSSTTPCTSDTSTVISDVSYSKIPEVELRFLMGLDQGEEEASEVKLEEPVDQPPEDFINGGSEAMRRAQRYLRDHRIFEFFQFLIAHLLSETPNEDPITFLINILDKCLTYRSGIADPPLLYNKKHIESLFNLMDRMRTGFIDLSQYKTGMYTLGIKSFNPSPPISRDGEVPKVFFMDEAYECLKDLLNDMLRRRLKPQKPKKVPKPPPPSRTYLGLQ